MIVQAYLFSALIHKLIILFDFYSLFCLSSLDNFLCCLFAFSTMLKTSVTVNVASIQIALLYLPHHSY